MKNTIHLFNGFMNPFGGSELETLSLYSLLCKDADVRLWATSSRASSELLNQFPINRISLPRFEYPLGGTYIFLGAHWRNKFWPYIIPAPRRLIYVFNTFHPKVLRLTTRIPALLDWPDAELVLISEFQKKLLGVDGAVHPSPIDINRFIPGSGKRDQALVIGRLSRDTPDKHHESDITLYRELLESGWRVQIQGGTYLQDKIPPHHQLRLWPEGRMAAEDFLSTLDVFYYRTGQHVETFGRTVIEAMACGLPVVCHSHGGYADHIDHGENGFLFDTTEQARQILQELKADKELRIRVGNNARKTVEALFSDAAMTSRLAFYRERQTAIRREK